LKNAGNGGRAIACSPSFFTEQHASRFATARGVRFKFLDDDYEAVAADYANACELDPDYEGYKECLAAAAKELAKEA
jgi:hypothetical protein